MNETKKLTCKDISILGHAIDNMYPNFDNNIHQNYDEVSSVVNYLFPRKFKNFVEVGTNYGGSLWLYSNLLCEKGANVTGIDIVKFETIDLVMNKLKELGYGTTFINENSGTAYEHVNNIDLLHIDAEHGVTVLRDWKYFLPKVLPGGIILLHDTSLHDGPKELVKQINGMYPIKTFTAESGFCGITVVENKRL